MSKGPKPSASWVASKTAALEGRLEGVTRILQHSQETQAITGSAPSLPVASNPPNQIRNESIDSRALNGQIRPDYCPVHLPPMAAASSPSTAEVPTTVRCCSRANFSSSPTLNSYPLEDEAELEEYLEAYRTKMVTYFPIVVIAKDVTVGELSKVRPFLWLVIRAICSKNSARHAELGIEVKKVLGREMLLEGTKTLDLFLGLLVFGAWGHHHIYNRPIISTIIQLATSLAFDLGLTKPVPTEPIQVMMNYIAQGCPRPINSAKNPARTMEERRAVIGLFLVSSVSVEVPLSSSIRLILKQGQTSMLIYITQVFQLLPEN